MYQEIDQQWKQNGHVSVPICANDFAKTTLRLGHLAALAGLAGFLVLPRDEEKINPIFIPITEQTEVGKTQLVKRLLAISSVLGCYYPNVRAIHKDKPAPENAMSYDECRSLMIKKGVFHDRSI